MINATLDQLKSTPHLLRVVGASLLSSIGSLSQHLAPLFAVVLVADGRATLIEAAWVVSARSLGELAATIALPVFKVNHLGRVAAGGALLLLMIAFSLATSPGLAALLGGFALVGVCSGVLKHLGTLSVSAHPNRTFAFSLRLSLVLLVAGGIVLFLVAAQSVSSFPVLLGSLMLALVPLSLVALLVYDPGQFVDAHSSATASEDRVAGIAGLSFIFLFFVGISGFMSFAVLHATERGLAQNDVVWAFGGMKLAAGVWLFACALRLISGSNSKLRLHNAGLLVATMWCVYLSRNVVEFVLAFLMLEIALNGYAVRLQARATRRAPNFTGRWLNTAIFLGAACGPPLYAWAISAGLDVEFLAIASLVIALPCVPLISSSSRTASRWAVT